MRKDTLFVLLVITTTAIVGFGGAAGAFPSGSRDRQASAADVRLIKHIVIIMRENRSFDSYFGTFPGADGIPMTLAGPSVCVPDRSITLVSNPITTQTL